MILVQTQTPGGGSSTGGYPEMRHAGERQHSGYLPGLRHKARRVDVSVFAASTHFTFEQNEQRIRRIAFVYDNVPSRKLEFFRTGNEPMQLVVAEIGENIDLPQRGFRSLFWS